MKVTPLLAISFSLVASIALADNSAVTRRNTRRHGAQDREARRGRNRC